MRIAWRVYLVVGLILAGVYFVVPAGIAPQVLYDVLGLSSVIALVWGVRTHKPRHPVPWYLFAAGQLGFVLGDGTRAVYESIIGIEAPFPSLADVFYLLAYPVLAVGLALL